MAKKIIKSTPKSAKTKAKAKPTLKSAAKKITVKAKWIKYKCGR